MLKEKINTYSFLLTSVISLTLGIITLIDGKRLIDLILTLYGVFLILVVTINIIFLFLNKKKRLKTEVTLVKSFININFGIIIIIFKKYIIVSITLIFAIYILLIALTNLISYLLYRSNHIKGKLSTFINFIVNSIFSIILFSNTKMSLKYFLLIVGIYLILYSVKNLIIFIIQLLPKKITNKIKNNIEIPLPTLFAMILPQTLIREVNKFLRVDEIKKLDYAKLDKKPNLFVIVHLAHNGSASFGHVEIAYQDKIYSYGNYNKHNRKLFDAIGDGIILVADKKKYINYCVNKKNRYLIEFGLLLSEEEENSVKKRIDKILNENTIDYHSDLELYEKGLIEKSEFNDMSSQIYKCANGKYKKIVSGKNKNFFVIKNNCAAMANYLLKGNKTNILSINGIITPGTYYDYLNTRFMMKNTNVITRKIYVGDEYARTTRSRNSKRNIKKNTNKQKD